MNYLCFGKPHRLKSDEKNEERKIRTRKTNGKDEGNKRTENTQGKNETVAYRAVGRTAFVLRDRRGGPWRALGHQLAVVAYRGGRWYEEEEEKERQDWGKSSNLHSDGGE